MKTTLRRIKACKPGESMWEKLLSNFGSDLDKEIDLRDILKSNGIKDTVWVLTCVEIIKNKENIILFCADVVESALPILEEQHPKEKRPRKAIEGARDFIKGKIDKEELEKLDYDVTYAAYLLAVADFSYNVANAVENIAHAAAATISLIPLDVGAPTYQLINPAYSAITSVATSAYSPIYHTASVATSVKWQEIEQILLKYI